MARVNMPIWPWKAVRRPKGFSLAAVSGFRFDELRLAVLEADQRQRREGREGGGEDDRTGARTAAAVRRREGLVQIDVHGVDAEVAGAHLADDGVEVRAVGIEERAGLVDRVGDRDDVALEQAAGVRVGEHQRGDLVREQRLDDLRIDGAVLAGGHVDHLEAEERGGRGIGAVRGERHEHLAALAGVAARFERGADRHHAAEFAVRAGLRAHRDGVHAGEREQPAREFADEFDRARARSRAAGADARRQSPAGARSSR